MLVLCICPNWHARQTLPTRLKSSGHTDTLRTHTHTHTPFYGEPGLPGFPLNLMQSGTLEVFFHPPTGFPAGHQVYDLHNDGNSFLQFLAGFPIALFLVGRWGCQRGTTGCTPPIFLVIHIEKKEEIKQSFCGRMPFLSPISKHHSLNLIFSLTNETPEQGRDVTPFTPFTSALRRQYPRYKLVYYYVLYTLGSKDPEG